MRGEIAGYLGADPETRVAPSGQKITTFRIAVTTRRKDKETTVWWRVTIFGDRFDRMLAYIKKGSGLIVHGTMNPPEIYQNKEGTSQVSLELIADSISFLPSSGKGERAQDGQQSTAYGSGSDASSEMDTSPMFKPQTAQFQPTQFQPRANPFNTASAGASYQQQSADDEIPF